jgi:hypothetical protein
MKLKEALVVILLGLAALAATPAPSKVTVKIVRPLDFAVSHCSIPATSTCTVVLDDVTGELLDWVDKTP